MASPFPQVPVPTNIPLTLPLPVGFFNFPPTTGSQFNNNEQQVLAAVADSIQNYNATVLKSGANDLFATEQSLLNSGQTLNGVITSLAPLSSLLSSSTSQTTLQQLLSSPEQFITTQAEKALTDTGALGLPAAMFKAFGVPVTLTTSGSIGGGSSSSVSGGTSSVTYSFPTATQPFIDALVGQNPSAPPTNDFFSALQSFYNFYINNPTGFTALTPIATAFSQAGLSTNNINPSAVPYTFPLVSGNSFTQFVQMMLTWGLQPSTVLAELLLASPAAGQNISVSYQIFNGLSNNVGGAQGAASQASVRPFINAMFGVNPTTSSSTDPFDILFSLVTGPGTFIKSVFSSTAIANNITPQTLITDLISSPTSYISDFSKLFNASAIGNSRVTPQQLVLDLFTSPATFPADLLNAIQTGATGPFTNFFTGLFSSTPPFSSGNTTPQNLITDFFTNPINIPIDILNLVNVYGFAGISGAAATATSIYKWFTSLVQNFANLGTSFFVGQQQNNLIAFNDSVQWQNIPTGTSPGSSTVSGWGSSTVPAVFNSTNGSLQGDFGFAMACAMAAAKEMQDLSGAGLSAVLTALTPALSINFAAGTFSLALSAGNNIQKFLSAPRFMSAALVIALEYIAQLMGSVNNLINILNNAGIPTGPASVGFLPQNLRLNT